MSDVADVAPDAGADAGGAPPEQTEANVQVPENDGGHKPTPVSSRGPVSDEGDEKPKSLRDSLEASNKKLEEQRAKKTSEAEGKGDEKPDAKAKATSEGPEKPQRGQDGKFAAKQGEDGTKAEEKPEAKADAADQKTVRHEAPKGFDATAKADWEKTPETVRGATARRISELEKGIEQTRQAYEPLKEYDEYAKQNGTSLKAALDQYTGLERLLGSQNPNEKLQGLQQVFDYAGINPHQFAEQVLGKSPDEAASRQSGELQQLRSEIASLKQQLGGVNQHVQSTQEQQVMSQIEAFASQPGRERFEELAPEISKLLNTGYASDLGEAYDLAERINPAPQQQQSAPVQTRNDPINAEAQTLRGSKSISGSPSYGQSPSQRKPSGSIREAMERAQARLG